MYDDIQAKRRRPFDHNETGQFRPAAGHPSASDDATDRSSNGSKAANGCVKRDSRAIRLVPDRHGLTGPWRANRERLDSAARSADRSIGLYTEVPIRPLARILKMGVGRLWDWGALFSN